MRSPAVPPHNQGAFSMKITRVSLSLVSAAVAYILILCSGTTAQASEYCTASASVQSVQKANQQELPNSYLVYFDIQASRSDLVDVFIKFDVDAGSGYHSSGHVVERKFSGGSTTGKGIFSDVPDGIVPDASTIQITSAKCYDPRM